MTPRNDTRAPSNASIPAQDEALGQQQVSPLDGAPYQRTGSSNTAVSVVIPHFDDLHGLKQCLAALCNQTKKPDEIIVCDNGSPCGLQAVRDQCPSGAHVLLEPVKGAAAARNAGVEAAAGPILAFLDCDCVPEHNWLEAGCAALADVDLVGGAMVLSFADPARRTAAEAFEAQFAFNNKRYIEQEHFSVTANLFVTRQTFAKVGPFRADVPEDKDWGQRAHALGLRWSFAADAKVSHPARRSWAELTGKWRRLTREAYGYSDNKTKFLLRSYVVLLSSPAYIAPLLRSNRLHGWRERIDVAILVVRLRTWRLLEAHRIALRKAPAIKEQKASPAKK